jgi:hypothetical protein
MIGFRPFVMSAQPRIQYGITKRPGGLQGPSMDFAVRASLRLLEFVPDELVRVRPHDGGAVYVRHR